MRYCPNCGSETEGTEAFCPACGEALDGLGEGGERAVEREASERGAPRSSAGGGAPGGGRSGGVTRRELVAVGAAGVAVGGAGLFVLLQGETGESTAAVGDQADEPPPLDEVQVRLVDLRSPDVGVTSATIPFLVAFENPTGREVPSLSGDFDVFVNGERVGSDEIVVNRLEPGEETNYDLEVVAEYADVGAAIVSAIRDGSFDVRVTGTLNAGEQHREVTLSGSI